jgi:hypothetical protein
MKTSNKIVVRSRSTRTLTRVFALTLTALAGGWCSITSAEPITFKEPITFNKHIAPILQRSCQDCHRDGGVAPMPLVTYQQVKPFGGMVEFKTKIRTRAGAMPPWYAEKDIGIQDYKNDPSLSDEEIAMISSWVKGGMPEGNASDAPPPRQFADAHAWTAGTPDLIVRTNPVVKEANSPDWWGEIDSVPVGLTEDRYVASVEVKEVNDANAAATSGRETVGGRYIFHHMIWSTKVPDAQGNMPGPFDPTTVNWPVHEVGRNADVFDPDAGKLLRAGSYIVSDSVHLHSNGRKTTGHLQIGFRFHPKGYKPKYAPALLGLGNGVDISITGNQKDQQLHAYTVLNEHTKITSFEPHLHAPGERMCLEAIWGYTIETLSCVGYDHNWVRGYTFADHAAPLLPKGTVLHIVGYMNNSPSNRNVPDPRNWQGSGNRSVTNMFIDLGNRVTLNQEQFLHEMQERREKLKLSANDHVIGCPLCLAPLVNPAPPPNKERTAAN